MIKNGVIKQKTIDRLWYKVIYKEPKDFISEWFVGMEQCPYGQ